MNATIMFLGFACAQTPQASAIPPDQFLALVQREAVPKWTSYTAMTQDCELTYRAEFRHLKPHGELIPDHPNDKTFESAFVISTEHGSLRQTVNLRKLNVKHEIQRIECYNTRYSFVASGSASDKLAIQEISNPITPKDVVRRSLRASIVASSHGWYFLDKPLDELWKDKANTVDAVQQIANGNYLVAFRCRGEDGIVFGHYALELNPNQGWRIETVKTLLTGRIDATETNTYEKDGFAVPIPNRRVFTGKDLKTSDIFHVATTFSHFKSNPHHTEAEFTLSAFGFPEPVGVEWKKPTPRYVWFLVAAGAFAAIAVFFRWMTRHTRRPQAV